MGRPGQVSAPLGVSTLHYRSTDLPGCSHVHIEANVNSYSALWFQLAMPPSFSHMSGFNQMYPLVFFS